MSNKPTLTLCIITKTDMKAHTTMCYIKASCSPEILDKFTITQRFIIGCSFISSARSLALTQWYKNSKPQDLFMFIDSDQTFLPQDILRAIELLTTKNANVVCGVYSRHNGDISSEAIDKEDFLHNGEGELKYGAGGFMLISRSIIDIIDLPPVSLNNNIKGILPLFQSRVIEEKESQIGDVLWLSEDYSFSWLVRHYKGKLYGFLSPTIGHILDETKYIEKTTS